MAAILYSLHISDLMSHIQQTVVIYMAPLAPTQQTLLVPFPFIHLQLPIYYTE